MNDDVTTNVNHKSLPDFLPNLQISCFVCDEAVDGYQQDHDGYTGQDGRAQFLPKKVHGQDDLKWPYKQKKKYNWEQETVQRAGETWQCDAAKVAVWYNKGGSAMQQRWQCDATKVAVWCSKSGSVMQQRWQCDATKGVDVNVQQNFWQDQEVQVIGEQVVTFYRVGNQTESKCHISYRVIAKSHVIHINIHEHYVISSSLTHTHTFAQLDLLQMSHTNMITTEIYTPSLLCVLFGGTPTFKVNNRYKICDLYTNTNGIYVRASWNRELAEPASVDNLLQIINSSKLVSQLIQRSTQFQSQGMQNYHCSFALLCDVTNSPDQATFKYPIKSMNLWASTDIRFTISPTVLSLRAALDRTRAWK